MKLQAIEAVETLLKKGLQNRCFKNNIFKNTVYQRSQSPILSAHTASCVEKWEKQFSK